MAVNPQAVYDFWCSQRYMPALHTAWNLGDLYTYMSLRRDDMPIRELVVRACREAVMQAEQGRRTESLQWLVGFLQDCTPPAALVDYGERMNSAAVAHQRISMRAHFRCAEVRHLFRTCTASLCSPVVAVSCPHRQA